MTTNPYTLLIEMQLDGDYIKQESAVAFAKEYARLEIERITKQTGTNTLVMESLPQAQTLFWPCPNCTKDTSETKWLCCCSQECCKEYMDKHKQLSSGNAP